MAKTYLRTLQFLAKTTVVKGNIPPVFGQSTNFSDMRAPDGGEFDVETLGDQNEQEDLMLGQMQADAFLLALLSGFNDRQKIILMYQLLREAGYNLNHADCAKTLNITRERYMVLLKDVKKRSAKILQIPAE